MTYKEDITPIVSAMESISITGNIIPPSWYQAIKTPSGKTALLAINILADIVYWYKPTILRDEETGAIISKTKKFKSDKLQRQYSQIVEALGCSKDQAKEAVELLLKQGLITREFRTVRTPTMILNNVMYLEPVPSRIKEITFSPPPSPRKSTPPMGEKVPDLGVENGGTNTEIITKTSPKIKNPIDGQKPPVKSAPDNFKKEFQPFANLFIQRSGLSCKTMTDYTFWLYGNKNKPNVYGFKRMLDDGLTVADMQQAFDYIEAHNRKPSNRNNQLHVKSPASLYTYMAKMHQQNNRNGAGQVDEDPGEF